MPAPAPHVGKQHEEKKQRDEQRSQNRTAPAATPARPVPVLGNPGELDSLGVRDLVGRDDRQLQQTLGILGPFKELGGDRTGRRARP